jgi:two-component system, response regulator RegA
VRLPAMAKASVRSPGPVNSFKWTIAHLRTSSVPGRSPCLIVFIGNASAASVVEALKLAERDNLGPTGTIEGDFLIDPSTPSPPSTSDTSAWRSLASIENDHIHRVLAECGGNKSEAARRLRITRRTLQRRLNKP